MEKNIFFRTLAISFVLSLVAGCASLSFENSSGNLNESLDDDALINSFIQDIMLRSSNITSETPLQGNIIIENLSNKPVSGKILFEITLVGSYQPVWVANLDTGTVREENSKRVPFIFYSDDIEKYLDFEEINAERAISNESSGSVNQYIFDLVVRSQNNESRTPFNYYLNK